MRSLLDPLCILSPLPFSKYSPVIQRFFSTSFVHILVVFDHGKKKRRSVVIVRHYSHCSHVTPISRNRLLRSLLTFSTSWTSNSCSSDVFTFDWTFRCLQVVPVRPRRSFWICVIILYIMCWDIRCHLLLLHLLLQLFAVGYPSPRVTVTVPSVIWIVYIREISTTLLS